MFSMGVVSNNKKGLSPNQTNWVRAVKENPILTPYYWVDSAWVGWLDQEFTTPWDIQNLPKLIIDCNQVIKHLIYLK